MEQKKPKFRLRRIVLGGIVSLVALATVSGYFFYRRIYTPNIVLEQEHETYLYIHTGWGFEDVLRELKHLQLLKNPGSFTWVAERMHYADHVKPGKYRITPDMNNRDLVLMLRSGRQIPVKVVFQNIRTRSQLASVIGAQIEADSAALMGRLNDTAWFSRQGIAPEAAMNLFIPNTYEFFWNTGAEKFMNRMYTEYQKFWNRERTAKAAANGMSRDEVGILASIVEQETYRNDEKGTIAGVYMNRLQKGWKLEADPTLIFAAGDYSIRRVLNVHKEIDSPYNTYQHTGLPPGPICIPSIASLDAVLNYEHHNYMFFCARDDFSGYHAFATTYSQHLLNARRFQNELNRRKIKS